MMFANPIPTEPSTGRETPSRRFLCVLYDECLTQAINWGGFTCDKCIVRVDVPTQRSIEDEPGCRLLLLTAYGRRPDGSYVEKKTIARFDRKKRANPHAVPAIVHNRTE